MGPPPSLVRSWCLWQAVVSPRAGQGVQDYGVAEAGVGTGEVGSAVACGVREAGEVGCEPGRLLGQDGGPGGRVACAR